MTDLVDVNHIVSSDILSELQELDLQTWSDSPNIQQILYICSTKKQELYDLFIQQAESFLIDQAAGVQLDYIGTLLGTSRDTNTDDDYRLILKIRGFRTRTTGTRSELIDIFTRFTGLTIDQIDLYVGNKHRVDVAFPDSCLSLSSAVYELTKLFPIMTSYRLLYKSDPANVFKFKNLNATDDPASGFSGGSLLGGKLDSLLATTK